MLRTPLLILALSISSLTFGQLSEGEGQTVKISSGRFSCYLPKYFEIQEQPPGVIHKASGAFVIAVKVPSEKKVLSASHGLPRSFFEDPRYEILSLREEKGLRRPSANHPSYWMLYNLQGFEFERFTTLTTHGEEQYLIIGNYPVKLKDQVQEEIRKIMESFMIR